MADQKRKQSGRIAAFVERGLGALALRSHRRPGITLAGVAAACALSAFFARDLYVDADLTSLLPDTFQSIQDIKKLSDRFGGTGWVVVVARDADPKKLKQFADDIAPKLSALDNVQYVDFQRQNSFFEDRALYFLDPPDLEVLRDRIKARVDWEKQNRNPLYLDLEDSEPPSLDFSDLKAKYNKKEEGGNWLQAQLGEDYYISEKDRMIVLLAKPASQSIDLAFSEQIVGEVQAFVDSLDLKPYGEDMSIQLTGRYKKRVDLQRMIEADLRLVSAVAIVLMLLYLAIHFRRGLAVVLIMVPLGIGMLCTFGFAALAFEKLNILTGFIGAILLGLGIDHGIHLLGRYEAEFRLKGSTDEAIRVTFSRTGRAITIAALTTMAAFLSLSVSEFRAFHEFGAIAGVGMALVVIAYSTCLPAFLALAHRRGWRPKERKEAALSGLGARVWRSATALAVVSSILLAIGFLLARDSKFNYSFKSLESNNLPSFVVDKHVDRILGYAETPVAILTNSMAEERHITGTLRAEKVELGDDSLISLVASGADVIPENQEAKQAIIREIADIVKPMKPRWIDDRDARKQFISFKRMVRTKPFTKQDLPRQLRLLFGGMHGTGEQGFVLVFPGDVTGGPLIISFADQVRAVRGPDGARPPVAGEDLVMADVLSMVIREAPPISVITLVVVLVTLWLLLGNWRDMTLCLLPAAFTLVLTAGLLPLAGLQVNYLNMVMFPILFGIGVDGGAHLTTRLSGGASFVTLVSETGRAITGAILTTGMGFGSLMLAHHHGLNTLGRTAVLGFAINLIGCLVVLPAFMALLIKRRGGTPDAGVVTNHTAVAADTAKANTGSGLPVNGDSRAPKA